MEGGGFSLRGREKGGESVFGCARSLGRSGKLGSLDGEQPLSSRKGGPVRTTLRGRKKDAAAITPPAEMMEGESQLALIILSHPFWRDCERRYTQGRKK